MKTSHGLVGAFVTFCSDICQQLFGVIPVMRLIPWDSFEINSPLCAQDLLSQLREQTEPPAVISNPLIRSSAVFQGEIDGESFQLKRRSILPIIRMPEIHGRIVNEEAGTLVRVQMIPDALLIFLQAGLFAVLSVTMFETSGQIYPFAAVLVAFAWFLNVSGFWFDAGESRRSLEAILNADGKVTTQSSDAS